MKKTLVSIAVIAFAVTSTIVPVFAATFTPNAPAYTPSWLSNLGIIVDSNGTVINEYTGESLGQAIESGKRILFKKVATEAEAKAISKELASGVKWLGKFGAVGAGVVMGVLLDPVVGGQAMDVQLCIDATHDDFSSFVSSCPQKATYKSSTPLKLRWNIFSEYGNTTTCSGFGAWDENIQSFGVGKVGSKVLQIDKLPGTYPYYLGCNAIVTRSLFGDIVQLHFIDFFKDLWKIIIGEPLDETVMAFSKVTVDVVKENVPPPSPTLSVSITAVPNNLTLPTGSGSVTTNLTAKVTGTVLGNINYTFYCNRSDTGVNITSPNNGKFDNVSNTSQPSFCNYSSPGFYKSKVIVERGNLKTQAQATVIVNEPINLPPTGYHDSVDNNTCHTTGWAYDPDDSSKSIDVHIYRDGPAGGSGVILDSFPTNVFRDDANKQEKISGNHGFDANLAPYISDGKSHKLYVYPIDTTPGWNNSLNPLTRTPLKIQCSAPAHIPGKPLPQVDIKVQ